MSFLGYDWVFGKNIVDTQDRKFIHQPCWPGPATNMRRRPGADIGATGQQSKIYTFLGDSGSIDGKRQVLPNPESLSLAPVVWERFCQALFVMPGAGLPSFDCVVCVAQGFPVGCCRSEAVRSTHRVRARRLFEGAGRQLVPTSAQMLEQVCQRYRAVRWGRQDGCEFLCAVPGLVLKVGCVARDGCRYETLCLHWRSRLAKPLLLRSCGRWPRPPTRSEKQMVTHIPPDSCVASKVGDLRESGRILFF